MEDKILDVKGKFDQDIEKVYIEAIGEGQFENVYVEFKDGRIVSYPRGDQSYADFASEVQSALVWFGATNNNKGRNWFVGYRNSLPSKLFKVEEEPVIEEAKEEQILDMTVANLDTSIEGVSNVKYDKSKFDGKKIALVAGAFVVGTAMLGSALWPTLTAGVPITSNLSTKAKVESVDYAMASYSVVKGAESALNNGIIDTTKTLTNVSNEEASEIQAAYEKESMDFLLNFNRSEDWMYSEITEEMYKELQSMGIEISAEKDENGNFVSAEAIFGLTAEELNAFRLVYSKYTNEQLVAITGGEEINVTDMVNDSESYLNRALRAITIAYLSTDKENLDIVNLGGFNDEELDRIHRYEKYLFDYKNLIKEGKDKEAEELMHKIKLDIYEYGYATNLDQENAKSYILKTLLPAFSIYSNMYQYKDDVTLHLYNGQTGEYEDVTVITQLYDEIMMRDLVEGYNGCKASDDTILLDVFDTVEFLKKFNIDTNKYSLVISDDGISKADQFNDGYVNKFDEYNQYLNNLKVVNAVADGATTKDSVNPVESNSELDTLTKDCKSFTELTSLINDDLEFGNKYPKNLSFFLSSYSAFGKDFMVAKGMLDVNGNVLGDTSVEFIKAEYRIVAETHTRTETRTERVSYKQAVSDAEMAKEDAVKRAEAIAKASATSVIDGATGTEKATTRQDIYNKVWNQNAVQSKQSTNLDGDDIIKNDAIDKAVEKMAEADAAINKAANEDGAKDAKESYTDASGANHYISGGDTTTYVPENADTATESEAERYNREHGITTEGSVPANTGSTETSAPAAPVNDAPATYGSLNDAISESGFSQPLDNLPDIIEDDTDNLDAAIETGSSIRRI